MKKQDIVVDDLSWAGLSASEIKTYPVQVKEILEKYLNYFKVLEKLENKSELTFELVVHMREMMGEEIRRLVAPCHTFEMLHTDKSMRELSQKVSLEIGQMLNDLTYNETLYNVFNDYYRYFAIRSAARVSPSCRNVF
jgi:Zn-dependent oligopeptidase